MTEKAPPISMRFVQLWVPATLPRMQWFSHLSFVERFDRSVHWLLAF